MANICENTLIIRGRKKEINRFKQFVGDDFVNGFSMEKLLPITDEMCKSFSSEYDAWVEFWGCSGLEFINVLILDKMIIVEYETDWTPSCNFVKNLSIKFPKLEFDLLYADICIPFGGSYLVQNGDGGFFTPPVYQVYFVKEKETDNYLFIVDYEVAEKYPICKYLVVPALYWDTMYALKGYSSHNVNNWESVEDYSNYTRKLFSDEQQ